MARNPLVLPAPLAREVAQSVDAPVRALPILGQLFAGLEGLGGSPRRAANWFADAGVDASWRIADLGCGLGALSIAIARRCRCRMYAIDGHPAFIEHARARADAAGLSDLCRFQSGDLRSFSRRRFDAAIMAGVWPIAEAAPFLRRLVGPGGLYFIDDSVFLRQRAHEGPTLTQARAVVTELGDRILREHVCTPGEMHRSEASMRRRMAVEGRKLGAHEPHWKPLVHEILDRQRRATRAALDSSRAVCWLVQRAD